MGSIQSVLKSDEYIQEGVSPHGGAIVLACTVGDDYDEPKNRILVYRNDEWIDFTSAGESVLSIDASREGQAYVLGENGTVIEFEWAARSAESLRSSRRLFRNDKVERIGPLRRLRLVSGAVYCAGSGGQLYRLNDGGFQPLSRLKVLGRSLTIEDITGYRSGAIFGVTSEGVAAVFDGSTWFNADLPTNTKLSSVCAVGSGRLAIAGGEGLIIVGQIGDWDVLDAIDSERTYWGIAVQNERIYAAHLGGIDVVEDGRLNPLEIPGVERLEFTVLRSGADGIWSFAGQTVGLITADGWRTVLAP